MVIKDLLNKVSKPTEKNDEKVAALREKLAKLQGSAQKQETKTPVPEKKPASPSSPSPKSVSTPSQQKTPAGNELDALAKASEAEQRAFATKEDPALLIREERTHRLMTKQVEQLIEMSIEQEKRLKKLEQERMSAKREVEQMQQKNDEVVKRMQLIDQRLEKFMGLYEIITNQYNPFAEKQGGAPAAAMLAQKLEEQPEKQEERKIRVSESISGASKEVPISQGTLSTENQKKMEQLLAELQAAEWEKKDVVDEEETQAIDIKEKETQDKTVAQMHEMLAGFENRMKEYLDTAVQSKLHDTFSSLEGVLNEEIEQAVNERVSDLKKNEDIIESAIKEMEQFQSEKSPEEFLEVKEEVAKEIRHVDDQIKAIPPSLYFRLGDGRVLKSKKDLLLALQTLPDNIFSHHVSSSHNHFADWLEMALNDPVGGELRGKSRQEMIQLLE